jgi:hypothetical protein
MRSSPKVLGELATHQRAGVNSRVETAAHPAHFMQFNAGQPHNCLVPAGNPSELGIKARRHQVPPRDVPLTGLAVFSKKPYIIASCSRLTPPIFPVKPLPANHASFDATTLHQFNDSRRRLTGISYEHA